MPLMARIHMTFEYVQTGWPQALVARDKEPITPFIARIGALARSGESAVLVMGGSGDYFGALRPAHVAIHSMSMPLPLLGAQEDVRAPQCCTL